MTPSPPRAHWRRGDSDSSLIIRNGHAGEQRGGGSGRKQDCFWRREKGRVGSLGCSLECLSSKGQPRLQC